MRGTTVLGMVHTCTDLWGKRNRILTPLTKLVGGEREAKAKAEEAKP